MNWLRYIPKVSKSRFTQGMLHYAVACLDVMRCQFRSINSGLPLKKKKEKMLKAKTITTEKGLRELIERNLTKRNSSRNQTVHRLHTSIFSKKRTKMD